ncbi:MAG: hypothetical protein J0L72_12245, partial [Armatimonadetes bacterium]|nr:hypothetical protein [Armatimonadota bacterium]
RFGESNIKGGSVVQGYGNQNGRFGNSFFGEGAGDMYVQRFAVDLSDMVPFDLVVGRIGAYTDNPYIYKHSDNTPYFDNSRWDNPEWLMDGAIASFKAGNGKVRVFGGNQGELSSNHGVQIQPIGSEVNSFFNRVLGIDAAFGIGTNGKLNLAYVNNFTKGTSSYDRLEVFGGGVEFGLSNDLNIAIGYSQSTQKLVGSTVLNSDEDNTAIYGDITYRQDNWGFAGGLRRIEQNYFGLGGWDRIGTDWAPVNIQDIKLSGWTKFGNGSVLKGTYLFGDTIENNVAPGFYNADYSSLILSLEHELWSGWKATLGYENVDIDIDRGTSEALATRFNVTQKWYTLGLSTAMSANNLFKLTYQYGDVKNDLNWGVAGRGNYKGHILTSQISIKF